MPNTDYFSALEAIGWIMNPPAPLSPDDVLCSEQVDVWRAHRFLIAEAAEGRVGVEGTPGTEDAPQQGGFPQLIPSGVFAVPNIGFGLLGDHTLGLDLLPPDRSSVATLLESAAERFTGPYYWHVRIRAQDVRARWPNDNGMAALRTRLASLALEQQPDAPTTTERPGFIWAHRALRLLAFGDADWSTSENTDAEAALAAVEGASKRLCDALANVPDGTATGLRGHGASAEVKSDAREDIPASAFADPHQKISLAAWLTHGGAVPTARFVAWRKAIAPDWCEVLLPATIVDRLRIKPTPMAWMQANVTHAGHWKRDAAIATCRKEADCTDRDARAAWDSLPAALKRTRGRPAKIGQ